VERRAKLAARILSIYFGGVEVRIVTWNVNGLRAAYRKGFAEWLLAENPDVCCLQETKVSADTLPKEIQTLDSYRGYFSFASRPGYSGVATLTKEAPLSVGYSIGEERFDTEGRTIVTEYPRFILFNTYFPNGGASPERLRFKMEFYERYLEFLMAQPKPVVVCGDVNTAHKEIDLARPKANEKNTGFLPAERAWIDKLVASGFADAFRLVNQQPEQYTWWDMKTRARERNIGWRIDYFFISQSLISSVKDCTIHADVLGSDHCPLSIDLDI
jgi:exodeoxyribonuclease-3